MTEKQSMMVRIDKTIMIKFRAICAANNWKASDELEKLLNTWTRKHFKKVQEFYEQNR